MVREGGGRISIGVDGLDRVLDGGLPRNRAYTLRGGPGSGKTMLGEHFLTADRDATSLFVSLEESAANLRENAASVGIDLSDVTIDGISGYRLSIRGEADDLVRELPALCRYLRGMGVTVLLVDDVPNVTGEFQATSERISYLADNILFIRYLEHRGEIRKAVGVLKKRSCDAERLLREFEITSDGLRFGDPLRNLSGILSGTPEWTESDG